MRPDGVVSDGTLSRSDDLCRGQDSEVGWQWMPVDVGSSVKVLFLYNYFWWHNDDSFVIIRLSPLRYLRAWF